MEKWLLLLAMLSAYLSAPMSKTNSIHNLGTTGRYSEAMARIKQPGDYVLVLRGKPRAIVMACPDGCGEHVIINLDRQAGPAWRRFVSGGKLSIYPSVWRDSGCRAHFIIVRDHIYWCGSNAAESPAQLDKLLVSAVLEHLNYATPMHYEAIADLLGAVPWEVLWACAALARAERASEPRRGCFIRR